MTVSGTSDDGVVTGIEQLIADFFDPEGTEELRSFQKGLEASLREHRSAAGHPGTAPIEDLATEFSTTRIPDDPSSLDEYLRLLNDHVIPNAVDVSQPRYAGHMTSSLPNFLPSMSQLLTALNQNVVKIETSKVFTLLERQTMAMMHRLAFDRDEEFYEQHAQNKESVLGIVTSGGTLANITALWIARNKGLRAGDDFGGLQRRGLLESLQHYGYRDCVVIGSELMHYSMDKLGSLLGFGEENILKVRLKDGSIDTEALEETVNACIEQNRFIISIVGIAGTTETGSVDDLRSLGEVAKRHGIHYHVDAAWGGPILFSEEHRDLLDGIDEADTITICGHKQLYLPQGISMVLCREPDDYVHIRAMARYQARADSFDLGKHSPEGSRPAASAYLHAGLSLIGRRGYAHLIDEGIRKARRFAERIDEHPAFQLIETPDTNIVVYRYVPADLRRQVESEDLDSEDLYVINAVNEVLQDHMFLNSPCFISRTTLPHWRHGWREEMVVLRAVIANPLTTEEHLEEVLDEQARIAEEVLRDQGMSFAQVLKLLARQTSSAARQ